MLPAHSYCSPGEGAEPDGITYRANRKDGVRAVRWEDQAGQGRGADGQNLVRHAVSLTGGLNL